MKLCSYCETFRPHTDFHKKKRSSDGLTYECKDCKSKRHQTNKATYYPKLLCACGKTVYRYCLDKHLSTNYHSTRLNALQKTKSRNYNQLNNKCVNLSSPLRYSRNKLISFNLQLNQHVGVHITNRYIILHDIKTSNFFTSIDLPRCVTGKPSK